MGIFCCVYKFIEAKMIMIRMININDNFSWGNICWYDKFNNTK